MKCRSKELTNRAGVTRQAILSIEKGAYYPSLELAFKISRVFNAGVEEVFSYEENDK
ncbi:MAG: helix-turn-helix transcriptional regulator [Thermoclostridium sp.]|nr:helix-turn-helix transcriptional regulator [Thermoclostridium sp.]